MLAAAVKITLEAEFSRSAQPHSSPRVQQARRAPSFGSAAIEGKSAPQFERSFWNRPTLTFGTNEKPRSLLVATPNWKKETASGK